MADHFSQIIFQEADAVDTVRLSALLIRHLVQHKVISPQKTDCILDGDEGYPPGKNYIAAVEDDQGELLSLRTNGVSINPERMVYGAEDGAEKIECPDCGADNVEGEWQQALSNWWESGSEDEMVCVGCGKSFSLREYKITPPFCFAALALTFWNWGTFRPEFVAELENTVKLKASVLYGRR